ncbi:MAG: cytochrome c [Pseudomonadota bacterium]|jgi:cytochrome c556|nr:cytochrome c [Pseudomonadota bacterium]
MAFFKARPLRAAILSAALLASGAQAADEGAAEYREAIFEAIGGHMSAMVGIIKGEVPHRQDLALHAKGIAALAPVTQHIFPADSYIEGGHAKAEIWSDPDAFAERRQNFLDAAAALGAVADSGDQAAFMGAFKTLGGACKGCHDNFRAK